MYLRGIPSPESVGKNAPGEERLSPSTSICKTSSSRNLDAATQDASDGDTKQGSLGQLAFGVRFWVGWLGEVSTPKGLPVIQAPEAHEKVFRGESDGQEMTKKQKA